MNQDKLIEALTTYSLPENLRSECTHLKHLYIYILIHPSVRMLELNSVQ